jgi:hypothetical protein
MGLKSGSRDAGLDDESDGGDADRDASDPTTDDQSAAGEQSVAAEQADATVEQATDSESEPDATAESSGESDAGGGRPTMDSIPYKLRRDKVNEGREQVPYFLREEVIEAEADLQTTLEDLLGEDVYKSDYREAAMVLAQRNPELVAEVLREWGYDLDAT